MKYILRPFYWIYQYLIAWPILCALTVFTAVFTICTVHWRNAEFVHKVQQFWSRSFFWLMFLPVSVDGTEHIKPGQSYVFVSNHQSMFDVWLIYGWLPVIFKWLMKAELRKVPFVGTGCKAAGHIFVDRRNAKAALESLKETACQRRVHGYFPGRHAYAQRRSGTLQTRCIPDCMGFGLARHPAVPQRLF